MTSFWLSLAVMPAASLMIAWVYVVQYRHPTLPRPVAVAVHTVAVAAMVLAYFWLAWDHAADTVWRFPGWAVFAAGSALFWWAAFRHKASLVPQDGYPVFSDGPYRLVRHPIYAGGFLGAAGLVLVAPAWPVLVVLAVLAASLWLLLGIEEYELLSRYGRAYEDYCTTTPRLIPFVL